MSDSHFPTGPATPLVGGDTSHRPEGARRNNDVSLKDGGSETGSAATDVDP